MDAQSNRGSTGQLSTGSGIVGGGGMHHSLSTPAGVDGGGTSRTPPPTPKKGGKMLAIRVQMLDDAVTIFQVQAKAIGKVLFEQVCKQLHLLEADYFGLEYVDTNGTKYWLDLQKPLSRQLGLSLVDPLLYFCVKFYTPDPGQLEEEYTRYLFCLQVKRDLAQGVMQCNENTAALMASYIVQAECGDYVTEDYPDHTYLSTFKFIPTQDHEMERRIMENHKKHAGQSPAEADLNLLETARRCEYYGIKMHPAKDVENIPLTLSVAHMGIIVFQNYTKINTFSWAKIRKISFKRKRFLIKLHPEGYGFYKDIVEFLFEGRNECKNFWKKCVENHGFFRCSTVKNISRHKTRVLSRGSSFRYSGKTQKQIIEFVRDNYVKRQTFQRSASFRHSSAHSSATNMHSTSVGNSISAHPLLPLGDVNLSAEAVKLSASLGSTGWSTTAAPSESPASQTTRPAYRPRITPTTWSSDRAVTNDASSEKAIVIRPPVPPRTTNSPSPPPTTQSPSPETSVTTSPIRHMDVDDQKITGTTDVRNQSYISLPRGVHEAAVHRGDTDDQKAASLLVNKSNGLIESPSLNNNVSYLTSTPNHRVNGNVSDISLNATNGYYDVENIDISPIRNYKKEQLLNSLNANDTRNSSNNNTTIIVAEIEGEVKRKHRFVEKGYYMAKEIFMTEITYKNDLDVINVWFREDVSKEAPEECETLLALIQPIAVAHDSLLKDLEQRLQSWDIRGGSKAAPGKIADVLMAHLPPLIPLYQEYMDEHINVLESLEVAFKHNSRFEKIYRDFEVQKVCYLPFTTFILKPLHRLMQYRSFINRLLKHYGSNHPDRTDALTVANCLKALINPVPEILEESQNISTLSELQKDIVGFDNLFQTGRKFIRHGSLLKLSSKKGGYQQRMFFLFSDILLYASRSQATLQFKVHGHLPLRGVLLEDPEGELADYGFIIYGGSRSLTVAASTYEEKEQWKMDLKLALQEARDKTDTQITYLSLKSCSSSDELLDQCGNDVGTQTRPIAQRSNTPVHVCWHRSTSIGMKDEITAVESQLSGYLLRKFKSSNGWQKLWVVFTNFCLFFYKSFNDEFPLASLPLLGYSIGAPTEEDAIHKDFVFKLQYKNHVYFFRSESEYTYNRWVEVINSTTQTKLKKKLRKLADEDSIESSPEK